MTDFDFFGEAERTIAGAEVAPGDDSPSRPDKSAVASHDLVPQPPVSKLEITLDTGETISAESGILLGRQPSAGAITIDELVLVPISDADGLISRSHLLIFVGATGLEAQDLGSTNGTLLRRGGRSAPLPANQPAKVRPGDILELGLRTVEIL